MLNEHPTASGDAKTEAKWETLLQALHNPRSVAYVEECCTKNGREATNVAWVAYERVWPRRDELVVSVDSKLEREVLVQDTVTLLPPQCANEVEAPAEEEQERERRIGSAGSRNGHGRREGVEQST